MKEARTEEHKEVGLLINIDWVGHAVQGLRVQTWLRRVGGCGHWRTAVFMPRMELDLCPVQEKGKKKGTKLTPFQNFLVQCTSICRTVTRSFSFLLCIVL